MFDLHILHAVANAVAYYKENTDRFDPLFPNVSANMRSRMFQFLQDTQISFDAAYSGKTGKKLPLVTCEVNEQYYDQQGIGNRSFSSTKLDETPKFHIFTSQEAVINIYAVESEAIRVLQRIVQSAMLIFTPSFINAGYQNILYVGSTPLVPDEGLRGEALTVYARQIRYAALHLLEIPANIDLGVDSPEYDVQVQSDDITPSSGVTGGVSVQ